MSRDEVSRTLEVKDCRIHLLSQCRNENEYIIMDEGIICWKGSSKRCILNQSINKRQSHHACRCGTALPTDWRTHYDGFELTY